MERGVGGDGGGDGGGDCEKGRGREIGASGVCGIGRKCRVVSRRRRVDISV